MKIEQKKAPFAPITLTLESVEELQTLWMHLNVCPSDVKTNLLKGEMEDCEYQTGMGMRLFSAVDDILANQ